MSILVGPTTAARAHTVQEESADIVDSNEGFGGPFVLVNHEGKTVADEDFRGQVMIIYFGYTHCPDICPVDTRNIAAAIDLLGDAASKVQPLFITLDPERDPPMRLAEWLSAIHPKFVGLTGTSEQIASVTRAYKVVSKRVDTATGYDYTMNHPGLTYVMDGDGHFLFILPPGTNPELMAEEIRAVLSDGN